MSDSELTTLQRFLSEDDFAVLFMFHVQTEDCDADGYTARKEDIKRLAELGAVQSHGFGRYSVTSFGHWLIETQFEQSPSLPLRTAEEWNRINAAKSAPAHGENGAGEPVVVNREPVGYVNARMLNILAEGAVCCTHISPAKTEFQQVAIYTEAP